MTNPTFLTRLNNIRFALGRISVLEKRSDRQQEIDLILKQLNLLEDEAQEASADE